MIDELGTSIDFKRTHTRTDYDVYSASDPTYLVDWNSFSFSPVTSTSPFADLVSDVPEKFLGHDFVECGATRCD